MEDLDLSHISHISKGSSKNDLSDLDQSPLTDDSDYIYPTDHKLIKGEEYEKKYGKVDSFNGFDDLKKKNNPWGNSSDDSIPVDPRRQLFPPSPERLSETTFSGIEKGSSNHDLSGLPSLELSNQDISRINGSSNHDLSGLPSLELSNNPPAPDHIAIDVKQHPYTLESPHSTPESAQTHAIDVQPTPKKWWEVWKGGKRRTKKHNKKRKTVKKRKSIKRKRTKTHRR
jgi:hypothetical protein